jgi:hypothetical protein
MPVNPRALPWADLLWRPWARKTKVVSAYSAYYGGEPTEYTYDLMRDVTSLTDPLDAVSLPFPGACPERSRSDVDSRVTSITYGYSRAAAVPTHLPISATLLTWQLESRRSPICE